MELSSIHVYPIKGARGLSLAEAELTDRGLRHDRRFMVVSESGLAITQREIAELALVVPTIEGEALSIAAPGMTPVRVPLAAEGPRCEVAVWSSTVAAIDLGRDVAEFFSTVLGAPARLVFMPEDSHRAVKEPYGGKGELVSFADAFPFLLASESSLDDLNRRMGQALPMDRFRPNLVVSGAEPWAEDSWDRIRIGDIEFDLPKPCDRCVVTTIDQRTAERGREPLATMAKFRARDSKVYFGENLLHRGLGTLRVGAPCEVLSASTT